ncbi:MAG: trehalose-phosphatase [Thermodesulfovibrionales bacterium]
MKKQLKSDYIFDKNNWETICLRIMSSDKIALFLDFDGTLVPIQEDPSCCVLEEGIKQQLKSLAGSGRCYITILSGRSLPDIKAMIDIPNICYSGNHGLVISGNNMAYVHPKGLTAKRFVDKAARMLNKEIAGIEGAWIERKSFTASLHYRSVRKGEILSVKKAFYKIVSEFSEDDGLAVIRGKMVLELVPDVSWTKGSAATWILNNLKGKYLPICVGDDITDESVFSTLYREGITVRVGRSKRSAAKYYLKGQGEVALFLQHVLDAVKPESTGGCF